MSFSVWVPSGMATARMFAARTLGTASFPAQREVIQRLNAITETIRWSMDLTFGEEPAASRVPLQQSTPFAGFPTAILKR